MLSFPHINPVIISIGPLSLRWYGFMYFAGFISGWFLGNYRAKRPQKYHAPFKPDQFSDVLVWSLLGVIAGARLGYVIFYKPLYYLEHPAEIFALWHGGMSFHGGLLGVVLCVWLAGRKYKSGFLSTMDFIAPLVPPGLFFGRIGNFINAELWGRVTSAPWGMVFPTPEAGPLPRHPSQLYEAALEGVLLFIIVWWYSSKPRPRGAVSGLFALGYGSFRFIVEFARQPDSHLGFLAGGFLTMGMLLCLPLILIGIWLLYRAYKKNQAR